MKWRRKKTRVEKPPEISRAVEEPPNRLFVSRGILRSTHEFFLPYWAAGVETACFWFGVNVGRDQVATTLALPKLYQTAGGYRVDSVSMRRLSSLMSEQGLENLAQVHTHPSNWIGHSSFDDEHAYSTRKGSLSLVWPNYGLSFNHDLTGVGVHEYRRNDWVELPVSEIRERIRIIDSVADCRWQIQGGIPNSVERDR